MSFISIPKVLREKLGDEGSEALVNVLNNHGDENKQSVIEIAEQRFETKLAKESSLLREGMADIKTGFETRLHQEISSVRYDIAEMKTSFEARLNEEISSVRNDMADMKTSFEASLSVSASTLREEMVRGDQEIRVEVQKTRADIIKWMFIFWVGQIGIITGILFAFYKIIN